MEIGEVERVAGNLALDFLNTVEDRLRPEREELLRTPADLAEWGLIAGILGTNGDVQEVRCTFF